MSENQFSLRARIATADGVQLVDPELAYWNEVLSEEDLLDSQNDWLRASRGLYAHWIRKYLPPGYSHRRILKTDSFEEIRGTEVVQALEERFARLVTIDLAFPALRQSARRAGAPARTWVQTPVQALPFATASFGGVVSLSTLDHFQRTEDIRQALAELARVTQPGGTMLLTLDNGWNPIVALRNALPHEPLAAARVAPYRYGKTLGPIALRRTLARTGWHVEQLTAVLHSPRVLAVALASQLDTSPKRRWFDAILRYAECAERLPTRFLTGHFLLAVCTRTVAGPNEPTRA